MNAPSAPPSAPTPSLTPAPNPDAPPGPVGRYRSKTAATWLALLGGSLGLHRLYLKGWGDLWAWLHVFPTLVGVVGVLRMRAFGQDDRLSWLMIPALGLMLSQGMLHAIIYGLKADEAWDRARNPGHAGRATGWGAVMGVIVALLVGATLLMGTIAFGGQKFFEWQLEPSAPAQTNNASPK